MYSFIQLQKLFDICPIKLQIELIFTIKNDEIKGFVFYLKDPDPLLYMELGKTDILFISDHYKKDSLNNFYKLTYNEICDDDFSVSFTSYGFNDSLNQKHILKFLNKLCDLYNLNGNEIETALIESIKNLKFKIQAVYFNYNDIEKNKIIENVQYRIKRLKYYVDTINLKFQ